MSDTNCDTGHDDPGTGRRRSRRRRMHAAPIRGLLLTGLASALMAGAWSLVIGILRVLFAFRVRSLVRSATR